MQFLMLDLHAPLASWGEVAIGGHRPSERFPTRSAILGLVGAAMGVEREDDAEHARLASGLGMASRLDREGPVIRDYHTAQVPPTGRGWHYKTRADETSVSRHSMETVLTTREYRTDVAYTMALWQRGEAPSLSEIKAAFERPRFPLYLGRRSCPPARPLAPRIIEADSIIDAFARTRAPDVRTHETTAPAIADADAPGIERSHRETELRDEPLSRRRRTFGVRPVHHLIVPRGDAART